MKIGIIGLGLIGGSIAHAVKETDPSCRIIALNRSEPSLLAAKADGVVDVGVHEITGDFEGCDVIFLCAPVQTNIEFLPKLQPYLSARTILTDVGSVKNEIHEAVSRILPDAHFIGGHPMAGKEKVGYTNSSAALLRDCYYYVTPSAAASKEDVEYLTSLIERIGCHPVTVPQEKHDFIVAAISHIPHLAAYMLVKLVKDQDTPEEYMRFTAAGGFKDTTRIASSDPTMWEQIFLSNRDNILKLTDLYIKELTDMRELIAEGDGKAMHRIFESIRDYRNSIIG